MTRAQHGFTLIEVLVAFAILALALTSLFGTVGAAYRTLRLTRSYDEALATARSQLDRVGADVPAEPGQLSGRLSDGTTWRLTISPLGSAPPGHLPRLLEVTFAARDVADRPLFALRTIRLAGNGALP